MALIVSSKMEAIEYFRRSAWRNPFLTGEALDLWARRLVDAYLARREIRIER